MARHVGVIAEVARQKATPEGSVDSRRMVVGAWLPARLAR
jgi:hypothetical protein